MVRLTGPSSGPLSPLSGSGLPLALSEQGTAVELATTERVVKRDQFIFSLPYFFLKTTVELTDRRLVFERPNTMLGVIPIGKQKDTVPLRNVASVGTSTRIGFVQLILGILLALVGGSQLGKPTVGSIIVLALGVLLILNAFQAKFRVTTNGGDKHFARIAATEKSKAQAFADQVNTTIAAREDGTNVAPPPAKEMTPVAVS